MNLQELASAPVFPVNIRPGVTHQLSPSVTVIPFPGSRRSVKERDSLSAWLDVRHQPHKPKLFSLFFLINWLVIALIMLLLSS